MRIILAGGPMHGRRLDQVGEDSVCMTAVDSFASLTGILATPPARPSFWRGPLAWWRWKPSEIAVPEATAQQHLYRWNGVTRDGARIYWHVGRDDEPPAGSDAIIGVLAAAHRRALNEHVGGDGWWEMSGDWYKAIRRALSASPGEPALGDVLLGRQVRVTLGSPRIVTKETP